MWQGASRPLELRHAFFHTNMPLASTGMLHGSRARWGTAFVGSSPRGDQCKCIMFRSLICAPIRYQNAALQVLLGLWHESMQAITLLSPNKARHSFCSHAVQSSMLCEYSRLKLPQCHQKLWIRASLLLQPRRESQRKNDNAIQACLQQILQK